ncbi:MAG TPA: L-histidine N(alpha)-methyltransferase [Acidimicrobiales bacterium]|nr:L-histidine N(alpha)-methyltransferase [Acidimicrobiales bacterium]
MTTLLSPGEVTVDVRLVPDDLRRALRRDARAGLSARPKTMPPVWFYDDRGCELYEEITRTPEYYPFRTERDLLRRAAGEIADAAGATVLVELGSGTSEKTRVLLDAMAAGRAGLVGYMPFDVADGTMRAAAQAVADDMGIGVHAVVGDFHEHLDEIPDVDSPRLVAFLGSTIGNFTPDQRHGFLDEIGGMLGPSDRFLLATDLVKPVDRLEAAYDDAAGVTAEFNLNLLSVLNRELAADFDPDRFRHRAVWDPDNRWIEMRLEATEDMAISVSALDLSVEFTAGEQMRTEISTKFTFDQVRRDLRQAGMRVTAVWTDPAGDYLVTLARTQVNRAS